MKSFGAAIILITAVFVSGKVAMGGGDDPESANRAAVKADLSRLASRAQHYYRTPSVLGGGGGTFNGITMGVLTNKPVNANGSYVIVESAGQSAQIDGYGVENGDDRSNPIHLEAHILSDSSWVVEQN